MEEVVVESYVIGGVTYELLHAQKFIWHSQIRNSDTNFKYQSGQLWNKDSLKAAPDVVVEIAGLFPDYIRVKVEESTSRGLEPKIIPFTAKPKE